MAGPADCILGLAPGEVCLALSITVQAVVSYTAVSPLPIAGGLFSAALSVALLLLAVNQHHRPVEPGLSSAKQRLPPEPGKDQKSSNPPSMPMDSS